MQAGRFFGGLAVALVVALFALSPESLHAQDVFVNGAVCPAASVQFSSVGLLANLPAGCSSNGNVCVGADVTFIDGDMQITAPASCLTSPVTLPNLPVTLNMTLNGVACSNATITFYGIETAVNAPLSCRTAAAAVATLTVSGNTTGRLITVDGRSCFDAQISFGNGSAAVSAPASCLIGAAPTPTIFSISPSPTYAGQFVTIGGRGFAPGSTVTVGGTAATVISSLGSTSLVFQVPAVPLGAQPAVVTSSGNPSSPLTITIIRDPALVSLTSVKSRKVHGAAGPFDIPLNSAAISGAVTVEPRNIGAGHVIVFQFDGAVLSAGSASVVNSSAASITSSVAASGSEVAVTIPTLQDSSRVTVSLTGVNGLINALASLGFLLGDVNNSRGVDAGDLSATKAVSGNVTNANNFRFDIDVSGRIGAADIAAVKARQSRTLGP